MFALGDGRQLQLRHGVDYRLGSGAMLDELHELDPRRLGRRVLAIERVRPPLALDRHDLLLLALGLLVIGVDLVLLGLDTPVLRPFVVRRDHDLFGLLALSRHIRVSTMMLKL